MIREAWWQPSSVILGTSLPVEGYPAGEVLAVYRLRWQIELAFKRMKSLLGKDRISTHTERASRSWLLAHLIMALLCDDISQEFLGSSPEDLLSVAYVGGLLLLAVLGTLALDDLLRADANVHRRLANSRRRRQPHDRYPIRP